MAALAYTAAEMAKALGLSRSTLYRHVKAGTLDIPTIHVGERVLFPKAAVHRWLDESSTPAGSAHPVGVVPDAAASAPRESGGQPSPGRGGQQSGEGDLSAA